MMRSRVPDGVQLVLVDSAAWATRIRFHAPELVERLAPRYDGAVTRVRVKVRPLQRGGGAS
jgi:hypothetical protein